MFYLLSDSEGSFILEKYSIFYTTFDSFLTHVKSTVENIFGFPLNQKKKKKNKASTVNKKQNYLESSNWQKRVSEETEKEHLTSK